MIDELLRGHKEVTKEAFTEYIERTQNIDRAVDGVTEFLNRLAQSQPPMPAAKAKEAVQWYLELLLRPGPFFPGAQPYHILMGITASAQRLHNVAFVALLYQHADSRSLVDSLVLSILFVVGATPCGTIASMSGCARALGLFKKLGEIPETARVFRRRGVWGLPAQGEEDQLPGWFLEHLGLGQVPQLPCCFSNLLNAYPQSYPQSLRGADFIRQTPAEMEAAKSLAREGMVAMADALHLFLKTVIVKDEKVKSNFIEYLFRLFTQNEARQKLQYNVHEVISDGAILCVSNVLSRFLAPVLADADKARQIPLDYVGRSPYLKEADLDAVLGKVPRSDAGVADEKFVTHIFYAKMVINLISYVPLGGILKEERGNLERARREAERLRHTDQVKYWDCQRYIELTASYVEYLSLPWSVHAHLRHEMNVMGFAIAFLKQAMKAARVAELPIFMIEGPLLMLRTISQVQHTREMAGFALHTPEALTDQYIGFCARVLSHPQIHVNYKQLAVHVLQYYLHTLQFIPGLLTSLVNYYVELQKALRHALERIDERARIAQDLNFLLKKYEYKDELLRLLEVDGRASPGGQLETKQAFILHVVSSLIDAQERGFEEIKKTAMTEAQLERAQEKKEQNELAISLDHSMHNASAHFAALAQTEELLLELMQLAPRAFLTPLVVPQLASMLNSSLISLASPKAKELVVKNKQKCGFAPASNLAFRIKMYTALKSLLFAKGVVQDGLFKSDLFEKAVAICTRKGLITQGERAQCLLFLQRIGNIQSPSEEEIDFPEEFIDPLTFAPMKDPVVLRPSNTRVDRATATMILMNDPIDPFTREPLTESDIVEDRELKEKIALFLQEHQSPAS